MDPGRLAGRRVRGTPAPRPARGLLGEQAGVPARLHTQPMVRGPGEPGSHRPALRARSQSLTQALRATPRPAERLRPLPAIAWARPGAPREPRGRRCAARARTRVPRGTGGAGRPVVAALPRRPRCEGTDARALSASPGGAR